MNSAKKARIAMVLGYICLVVGVLNVTIVVVSMARDEMQEGSPLLVTGLAAISCGIIMLAVSKRKPAP
jgi:uncharacterized membrane protein HdeD (DUF308 family)